jgi:hypothetical protein
MATQFMTGIGGKVMIATTTMNVTGWSFNCTVDVHDTTHSGSGGYAESLLGLLHGKGSFKANWDALAVPTDTSAPNLTSGVQVAAKFYIGTTGKYISATCNLTEVAIQSDVKGLVSYSCNFETVGAFVLPVN